MQNNTHRQLIGKIHIAKKDLGLDDEAYRGLLVSVTGKDSSAIMTDRELAKVVEELKSKGWKPLHPKTEKQKSAAPSIKKIYALWGVLQEKGMVKSRDAASLNRFQAKYTKKDKVKDLSWQEAQKVIEILKKIIERKCDE